MKYFILLLTAITLSSSAWAGLPPEIELDRFLLQAKSALDAKDYKTAIQSLENAAQLNIRLPETYYFHLGRAYSGSENWSEAREAYQKYLEATGTNGKFYREALEDFNQVDIKWIQSKKEAEKRAVAEAEKRAAKQAMQDFKRPDGNKVFFIDSSGVHGLEAKAADEPEELTWADAMDAASHYGSGWRLPTKEELDLLYQQKDVVGGFGNYVYWSSTESLVWTGIEYIPDAAWAQSFDYGNEYDHPMAATYRVRAVRAF